MDDQNLIAIIPAAGQGRRLSNRSFPKELTLIPYQAMKNKSDALSMRAVCEFSLEHLVNAGVNSGLVVINEHKYSIISFLKDGEEFGLDLGYVFQKRLHGLPHAINAAYNFIKGHDVALVLPDTIIQPSDVMSRLKHYFYEADCDVILAIFQVDRPQDFCQVIFDDQKKVKALYDKSVDISVKNTWGMAMWRSSFSSYLHFYLEQAQVSDREISLAEIFNAGTRDGLMISACPFDNATFMDIGNPANLFNTIQYLNKSGYRQ